MIPAILGAIAEAAGGIELGMSNTAAGVGQLAAANPGSQTLASLAPQIAGANKELRPFLETIKGVTKTFANLGKVAGIGPTLAIQAFESLKDAALQTVDAIASLVKLANPSVWKQFDFAVKDTLAVFGQMLIPVLRTMTAIVRDVANEFAGMTGLKDFFGFVADALQGVWKAMSPLVKVAIRLADALIGLGTAMAKLAVKSSPTLQLGGFLLDFLNTKLGSTGNATGAAAGNASFMSFEDVGRRAQEQAFAYAGGKSPEEIAEAQRAETNKRLNQIQAGMDLLSGNLGLAAARLAFGH